MKRRAHPEGDISKSGHEYQRQQDEKRHQEAGLPKKHVEAADDPDDHDDNSWRQQ